MKKIFICIFMTIAIGGFGQVCPDETNKTSKDIIRENGFKTSVNPLLTTKWNQRGAENSMLPFIDANKTEHAATGCGATALAQILKYWNYPAHGIGDNYYAWTNSYETDPVILLADFNSSYYDWDNMASVYTSNKNITQEQTNAIGKLMYDIAVALEMKLSSSTATQIEYIHTVLKTVFRYNPNMQLLRQINHAYTLDEWLTIIYKELSEGRPILMGGTYGDANHIFIADGYDEEGRVHLNLGHANRNNEDTYYDLTVYNQTYTKDIRMIIGICPQELYTPITSIRVSSPGKLIEDLGGLRNAQRVTRIKVSGMINATDIAQLGLLTQTTTGQLSYIDLSDCTIEDGVLPEKAFYTGNECNYTLQQIFLPEGLKEIRNNAFYGCRGLYEIFLPSTLTKIGNYAFGDCRYLKKITIPKNVSSFGANPFIYNKMDKITIENENVYYTMKNKAILSKDGYTFISLPLKPHDNYVIPEGVRYINSYAISEGFRLRSISFPSTLQTINSKAFYGYTALEHMYFYNVSAPQAPTTENIRKCIIHVPYGYKEEYAQKGWDKFAAIVDDCDIESLDINACLTENDDEYGDYYSLQGCRIKKTSKGIYIKKGRKIVVK